MAESKEDIELATRRSLISNAYQKSAIAREALDKEKKFRKATERTLEFLLASIKYHVETQQDAKGLELKSFHREVCCKLEMQFAYYWKTIIEGLADYQKKSNKAPHASLTSTYNKMPDIINAALKIITPFENFELLCQGKVPKGYDYKTADTDYTQLGNQDGIWGSAKGSDLKMALLGILGMLTDKKLADLVDVDISPIEHLVELSEDFSEVLKEKYLENHFFSFADRQTRSAVLLIDSGFEFGGHRFQLRYSNAQGRLKPKEYGPRDCSQFIEETIGSTISCTTGDLHYTDAEQRKTGKKSQGFLTWMQGKAPKIMESVVKACEITGNPDRDIQPGMVHCTNRFDTADCGNDPMGGHVSIVLGALVGDRKTGAYNLLTFGYNRDRPKFEGFGQQDFICSKEPAYNEATKKHVKSSLFTVTRKPGSK